MKDDEKEERKGKSRPCGRLFGVKVYFSIMLLSTFMDHVLYTSGPLEYFSKCWSIIVFNLVLSAFSKVFSFSLKIPFVTSLFSLGVIVIGQKACGMIRLLPWILTLVLGKISFLVKVRVQSILPLASLSYLPLSLIHALEVYFTS